MIEKETRVERGIEKKETRRVKEIKRGKRHRIKFSERNINDFAKKRLQMKKW